MTQTRDKRRKESSTAQRVAEKSLDVAIGGTALAAGKVAETIDRVIGKTESAMHEGRRAAQDKAKKTDRAIRHAIQNRDERRYEDRTRDELYELAIERDIEGRSAMRKSELIAAVPRRDERDQLILPSDRHLATRWDSAEQSGYCDRMANGSLIWMAIR